MAKKKQQNKGPKVVEEPPHQNAETTPVNEGNNNNNNNDDDTAERLSNLKSLNAMLVGETAKNRAEITGLMEDKKSLESELTRSHSVADSLRSDLDRVKSVVDSLRAELTRSDTVSGSLKSELDRVNSVVEGLRGELTRSGSVADGLRDVVARMKGENDGMSGVVAGLRDEVATWRERFLEMERAREAEVAGLRRVNDGVVREKKAKEKEIEVLVEEKSRNLNKVGELEREIEGLKRVNEDVIQEKSLLGKEFDGLKSDFGSLLDDKRVKETEIEGLVAEKSKNLEKVGELEREIEGLKRVYEVVLKEKEANEKETEGLVDEKSRNLVRVAELEKEIEGLKGVNVGVVKELDGLKSDVESLLEEKKLKEIEIAGLVCERLKNVERVAELEKEIECLGRVNEDVVEEKNVLEEVKLRHEDKIRELQCEVNVIRGNVLLLQESSNDQLENMTKLLSEINDHKAAFEGVVKERDDVKRALDEEKMNGVKLQVKLSEISKKMEETGKVIEELRGVSDTLVAEKKDLENKYNNLVKEKALVEKNYVKSNEQIAELEVSLKSKSDMLESAISMLRNATMQLSVENNKVENEGTVVKERGVDEEVKHYMTEIEAIRDMFKSREEKAGEMEKQMKKLQLSVVDAKRQKSFWTMVSSATTILAAVVSIAYAAGCRRV